MSYLQSRLSLFNNRAFSWYLFATVLAMFGNGLTYISMVWVIADGEHQVAKLAALMACFWLPNIVIGPFAGVWVDCYSRKAMLLICNGLRAVVLLIFFCVTQYSPSSLSIYLLAAFVGSFLAFYIPAALTLIREIVAEDELMNANATVDIIYELGQLVGIGFAGFIIHATSIRATFFINGLFYLLSFLAMTQVPYKKKVTSSLREPFFAQLIEGLRYLKKNRQLMLMYSVQIGFFMAYMTAPILLAPFAKTILKTSTLTFGFIEGAMSLGAVCGGIISPYLAERYCTIKTLTGLSIIGGSAFALFANNQLLSLACVYYFFAGVSFSAWPLITTYAQERTSMAYQGRVLALFNTGSGVFMLFFYLGLSVAGEGVQIAQRFYVIIVIYLVCLVALQRFTRLRGVHASGG